MALTLVLKGGREITWHLGEPYSKVNSLRDSVLLVQADGSELEFIKRQISGIPMTVNRVVRWEAPFAQFIASNL